MFWLALLPATSCDAPSLVTPEAATKLGVCEVPELEDMFGVRPLNGAFIQIASKWALPLCVDDAILHPVWKADTESLSRGDAMDVFHGIPLDGVRMTSTHDVAKQVLAIDRTHRALLHYELTMVGDCVTAKVVSRVGPHGWEPVSSVLDRALHIQPAAMFQAGRRNLEAALEAAGIAMEHTDNVPTADASCAIAGGVRLACDVLAELLACSPTTGVATFYLRTDGRSFVLAFPVADSTSLEHAQPIVVDEGGWRSPRVRDAPGGLKSDLEQSLPPALPASVRDTRPVSQAFLEIARTWGVRLCSEDGPLDPRWVPDVKELAHGASTDAIQTIELADLSFGTPRTVADEVLRRAEAGHPPQRYALRDIGGCLTATVVARVGPDRTSWEPLTPPLDTTIQVPSATTYRGGLDALEKGMRDAGFTYWTNPGMNGTGLMDGPCAVRGGTRMARDVLADVMACSPSDRPAVFALLTDGHSWALNLSVAQRDDFAIGDLSDAASAR